MEQLEKLEDEASESHTQNADVEKLLELQEDAQVAYQIVAPTSSELNSCMAHGQRNSVWLNDLLALDNVAVETRRQSSVASASHETRFSQLPQLLSKWTDQGEHWTQMHESTHFTNSELASQSRNDPKIESDPRTEQLDTNGQRQNSHDSSNDSPLTTRRPTYIQLSPDPEVTEDCSQAVPASQRKYRMFDSFVADTTRQIGSISISITPPMTPEAIPPKTTATDNDMSVKTDSKDAKSWGWRLHDPDRAAKRRGKNLSPLPNTNR